MPKWMESIHKMRTRLEKIFLMKADDEQIQSFNWNFNWNQPSNDTALNNFRPNPQRISSIRGLSHWIGWFLLDHDITLKWMWKKNWDEWLEKNSTENQFKETLPFISYSTSNPSGKKVGSIFKNIQNLTSSHLLWCYHSVSSYHHFLPEIL